MRTNVGSSSARQEESLEEKLYIALMREKWDVVVNIFRDHPLVHDKKMADMVMPKNESPDSHYDESRFDTALHWAITNEAPESIVEKLVNEIANTGNGRASQTLQAKDDKGDTPLHCAASRGSIAICRHITCVCPPLVLERNNVGETPLFLAALNGHQQTFLYLHSTCMEVEPMLPASIWKRNDGDTILHFTIRRKHFELSYQIIELYKVQKIGSCFNIHGQLPLNELLMIPSAFKNGIRLRWWHRLLYHFICVERERPKFVENLDDSSNPVSNKSCWFNKYPERSKSKENHKSSNLGNNQVHSNKSPGSVRKLKENHALCGLIMDELVKQDPWYRENDNAKEMQNIVNMKYYPLIDMKIQEDRIKITTALLIAAKNGLTKQVNKILRDIPVSVHDQLLIEKRNIVHVAIAERQSQVLEAIKGHKLWRVLREKVDADGNNALHLAAQLSKHTTWEIRGYVMQMQWEVMWFEYVKKAMPPYFDSQTNNNGKTPGEIFANEHHKLIKESNKSVKDTCGSYIVAATLVTGATFSACYEAPSTVLGHTFSISLLISFCFSITSLAAFLSIYSTGNERPRGYRRSLPLKLCLGFFSFCASLVSMVVSFYAALSLEFLPEEKYQAILGHSIIILPAGGLYLFTQIPFYWDLLIASLIMKVPKPRIMEEDTMSHFFHDSCSEQDH